MALIPLESNPDVMTKFLHNVGVPKKWNVIDVYGLEPDLLAIVPKPVLAVILLYPLSVKTDEEKGEKREKPETDADSKDDKKDCPDTLYYLQQFVPNACGTIALIHSVANNIDTIELEDGILKSFLDKSQDLSYSQRGVLLVATQNMIDTHKESAQEGQTEVPGENTPVYHHFVAFVHKEGFLYELDGRKAGPIKHGATTKETLLEDAAKICKEYMTRDPDEVRFTVVALTGSE